MPELVIELPDKDLAKFDITSENKPTRLMLLCYECPKLLMDSKANEKIKDIVEE